VVHIVTILKIFSSTLACFLNWGPLATNVPEVHRDEMKLRTLCVHYVLIMCKKKV